MTSRVDPDLSNSVKDLLEGTSRSMIMGIGGVLMGAILATAIWPDLIGINIWIVVPAMLVVSFFALKLMPKSYLTAHVLWQLSLAGGIIWLMHLFQKPEIGFFLALLPLIAVITLQRFSGMLIIGLVGAAVYGMYHGLVQTAPSLTLGLVIIIGGVVSALLGWVSFTTLLTVTEWSIYSNRQAQQNLTEAREHRAQLAKVAKELDQANIRLERAINMLVLARNEAEEAKDARNRFALAISHELRSPLNFIIGFSELMVNRPTTYAPLEKWPAGLYDDIQQVYASSQHLMQLVNDVLDLGQIDNLQMALLKEWVDPADLILDVEKMVQPAFIRKNLRFEKVIEPGLPMIFIDQTRIRQVLLNLISNGIRFTSQGGITISARMQSENMVVFCVADTGSGIDPDDLPYIFEPFHHGSQDTRRKRDGFGLGVPISRKFVELHGGQMWVESQVGKGTQFYFTLPAMGSRNNLGLMKAQEELDKYYWNRLKVEAEQERALLVISNDPAAAEVIAPYVENYELIRVEDLEAVEDQVKEFLPRAILVDAEVAHEVHRWLFSKQLPYDLPIVSFTFPGNPSHGQNLPDMVVDYLVKPVYSDALLNALKKLDRPAKDILVVDDDPAMVRFVERSLGMAENSLPADGEFRISHAYRGIEAIEQIKSQPPDVILLDIALPDISGWDVATRIKDFGVPIILVTAHDLPHTVKQESQDVLRVSMHRPLARHELSGTLKVILDQIHPRYPSDLSVLKPATGPAEKKVF